MKCLISGISGQICSYLAELMLAQGHEVYGVIRRKTEWQIPKNLEKIWDDLVIYWGDITDQEFVSSIIYNDTHYDAVYLAAAQTHVGESFKIPHLTYQTNLSGTHFFLEALKKYSPTTKTFFFATSEMFGGSKVYQDGRIEALNELSPMKPRSPYAISKLAAYNLCRLYRKAYNMPIYCGILFNTESPRRGLDFVTRKISNYMARLVCAIENGEGESMGKLSLGNIQSFRDWQYTPETVEAIYEIMQSDEPDDYVICSGETHSIKEYILHTLREAGLPCAGEKSIMGYVEISDKEKRPLDVDCLLGDPSKIKKKLGWESKVKFKELVKIMYNAEYQRCKECKHEKCKRLK